MADQLPTALSQYANGPAAQTTRRRKRPARWAIAGFLILSGLLVVTGVWLLASGFFATPVPAPPCDPVNGPVISDTYLCMRETATDGIEDGRTWTITAADAQFNVEIDSAKMANASTRGAGNWTLQFGAPSEQRLTPGVYEGAGWAQPFSPRRPWFLIGGQWRGCKNLSARFQVLEIATDPDRSGLVTRLAANFEAHCDGSHTLAGAIRFHATVGVPVAALTPASTPITFASCRDAVATLTSTTYLCTEDDSGAPQRSRHVRLLTPPHTVFRADQESDGSLGISASGVSSWGLLFGPPAGQTLQVGQYDRAEGQSFQRVGPPILEVTSQSAGCNELTGRFEILDLARDPASQQITRFAANFEQYCGRQTPGLAGAVRFHSAVALDASAVGPWGKDPDHEPPALPTRMASISVPSCHGAAGAGPTYYVLCLQGGPNSYMVRTTPIIVTLSDTQFIAIPGRDNNIFIVARDTDGWHVMFVPPQGQTLAPGLYENSVDVYHGYPTMTINGKGIGYPGNGRFEVLEMEMDPHTATVTRFAANFELDPAYGRKTGIAGVIRFNSRVAP